MKYKKGNILLWKRDELFSGTELTIILRRDAGDYYLVYGLNGPATRVFNFLNSCGTSSLEGDGSYYVHSDWLDQQTDIL